MNQRTLGRTGYRVTPICIGTSPLGLPGLYGANVDIDQALETIHAILDSPFTFIDTSNSYGDVERLFGRALAERGGLPAGTLLATKVDPLPGSTDFSGARVRASVTESLERLGLDRLQLVHFHDPERVSFEEALAPDGAVPALVAMREEGLIAHLGVAGFDSASLGRYLETDHFDVVLIHNQYTLVCQSASALFDLAVARGVGALNAAPYGGGMLAKGPDETPNYCYLIDDEEIRRRARGMEAACREAGVALAAVALQFSLRDERIASTVVGVSRPERVVKTAELADCPIPDSLWDELLPLISGCGCRPACVLSSLLRSAVKVGG